MSQSRHSAFELFLCICIATIMIAAFGAVFYGFRQVLLIIDKPDPVEQWIFTTGSYLMFGLALLFFTTLTIGLIWKRLFRR